MAGRACVGFPLRPEIAIPSDVNTILPYVLVAQRHHWDQAPAVLLVVHKLTPAIVPHAHAPHEAASPVIAVRRAVLVEQQERHVDFVLEQRPGDGYRWP